VEPYPCASYMLPWRGQGVLYFFFLKGSLVRVQRLQENPYLKVPTIKVNVKGSASTEGLCTAARNQRRCVYSFSVPIWLSSDNALVTEFRYY
jgi:hypothetical protein